jgi:RNA polymerase sigma-70 factor (ECF subfamily)
MDNDQTATRQSLLIRVQDPADHRSWDEFLGRYRPMIRGWCRHWFPDAPDDAAHEVFAKLVFVMQSFRYQPERGRFRGWLKTVTDNLMAELKRGWCWFPGDEVLDQIEAPLDLWERLAVEYDLELLENAKEAVCRRVKERTWRAWVETAENGRKAAEVARELGMRVGAVYQARHAVQELLQAEVQSRDGFDEPTRGDR